MKFLRKTYYRMKQYNDYYIVYNIVYYIVYVYCILYMIIISIKFIFICRFAHLRLDIILAF